MGNLPEMFEVPGEPITLAFSESGRIFFTERVTGKLWELVDGKAKLIKAFPIVPATGHNESGLLGIALDPNFQQNDYIYCFYTYGNNLDDCRNIVARIKVDEINEKTILDDLPGGPIHNGGIMAFGPDGKLFIGVGVSNEEKDKSQDLAYLGGKVLRINPDGSIPDDNPFPGSPVYSFGHRNIFGLSFHPRTGQLYICEEGPEENDEINIIEAGGNYGWPEVTGMTENEPFINPIHTYTPTITPTQSCFLGNNLYFGSYNEGSVRKLTLDENDPRRVLKDEIVYQGRPFGIIGVFHFEGEFFITTTNKIMKINLTEGE